MLRFSLALLCLSLLAVAEDEKAPSSLTLDDKTFKEKVGLRSYTHLFNFNPPGGSRPSVCDVLCSLVSLDKILCELASRYIKTLPTSSLCASSGVATVSVLLPLGKSWQIRRTTLRKKRWRYMAIQCSPFSVHPLKRETCIIFHRKLKNAQVMIGKVDCTVATALCSAQVTAVQGLFLCSTAGSNPLKIRM